MLKYETYLVPTLAGMDGMLGRYTARIRRDGDTRRLPGRDRQDLARLARPALLRRRVDPARLRRAGRAAAPAITASSGTTRGSGDASSSGTDAVKPWRDSCYHEELRRLRACGLSNAAVLRAATAAAADTLGRPDLGRIAPGAQADLVLVAGNPLRRLADARAVRAVVAARARSSSADAAAASSPHPRGVIGGHR